MNPANAIEVTNVSKDFKVYLDKGKTIKEKTLFRNRRKYEIRHVLDDISFQISRGQAVGLIGHNGCGKSTTLKLLTQIIYPTQGKIELSGRVSSLIELGAGFHPDMSGRENIYINASIFGLSRKEIDKRIDDIIEFSELSKFIDNPVRTYSSGMYMRLAFSVAINVDADILLIDEILAVGDINFQRKCFDRLKEIKKNGTTIVIVSHSLDQIEAICDRTIWIDEGKIREDGAPNYVHLHYTQEMEERRKKLEESTIQKELAYKPVGEALPSFFTPLTVRTGNGNVQVIDIFMTNAKKEPTTTFTTGEDITLNFSFENKDSDAEVVFGFTLSRVEGVQVYCSNSFNNIKRVIVIKDKGLVSLTFPTSKILAGNYMIDFAIHDANGNELDYLRNIAPFEVLKDECNDCGICRLETTWTLDDEIL